MSGDKHETPTVTPAAVRAAVEHLERSGIIRGVDRANANRIIASAYAKLDKAEKAVIDAFHRWHECAVPPLDGLSSMAQTIISLEAARKGGA